LFRRVSFSALVSVIAFTSLLTVTAHLGLKVLDLRESGILAACSEEIAQVGKGDTAVAALVEEGEGLLEVGALRLLIGHVWLVSGVNAIREWMRWFWRSACDRAISGGRER
jgi:hypothetical protein